MKKYKVVDELKVSKAWPTDQTKFKTAHRKANVQEKKRFPKGYEVMKKVDARLNNDEIAGHNTKTGKIKVSKKVPKKYRDEVAYHEDVEYNYLKKRKKK